MSGEATPLVFFDENSQHVESLPFYLYPGWVMQLMAFGFSDTPKVVDLDNPAKTLQAACMNMILFKDVALPERFAPCGANPVKDLSEYKGQIAAKTLIVTNGCPWRMDHCNNMAFLGVPGSYQLVLNDPEAPSVVRIFARLHKVDIMPRNLGLYFGGEQ